MPVNLRQALRLAVGPANVDAAGHAVADWFDVHNCCGAAHMIRDQLQDQQGGDAVPRNRPDTSLRAELLQKLATQREVLLNLCDRVDRLEMRADGLTPIERVERRWAKERSVKESLTVGGNGPAVSDGREPAVVMEQPSDRDLCQLYADTFDLRSDPASLGPAIVKFARAVLARWGHQPAPPAVGEVGELVAWLRKNAEDECQMCGSGQASLNFDRAAELLQQRHPEPVPISERLPGPEDCDGDGRCWLFSKVEKEWRLLDAGNPGVPHLRYCFSHSLPATALPLPQQETPND